MLFDQLAQDNWQFLLRSQLERKIYLMSQKNISKY